MTRRKNKSTHRQPLAASPAATAGRGSTAIGCGRGCLGGMTALLVARPLFPSESAASYGDGLTMVMLWIALAVFWLLGAIGRPRFALRFGWTDAAVLLLVGWHTVAALWAVGHGTPRPAVNMLWEWIGMGLASSWPGSSSPRRAKSRAVAAVMVALGRGRCPATACINTPTKCRKRGRSTRPTPIATLRDAGLWYPPGSPERELFESRLENTRADGHLRPDQLAGRVSGAVAGDAGRNGVRFAGETASGWWALCYVQFRLVLCLLLTKSRSGYIAAAVGLASCG